MGTEDIGAAMHPDEIQHLKRMAVAVVAMLPEGEQEALLVLSYARELVIGFLYREREARLNGGVIIPLLPAGPRLE